jgi:phage major head subunit gpT-like protein
MTMIRANFGDFTAPGLRKAFFDIFGRKETVYDKIYNMLTSNKKSETDSYITGFGIMPSKNEGVEVTYDDASQAYDVTYTHTAYAAAYRVTEEMKDDELYGLVDKMNTALAISAYARVETDGASTFNNGFSTSYTGGDGSALFVTDHALVHGGTEQNTLSTDADLSVTSLQQAIIDIEATVDDRGILCALEPDILLIPNELQFTAAELLKSMYVPYSADNEVNALLSKGLRVIPWNYLTDTDGWIIICKNHELNWFTRKPLTFKESNDFNTGDLLYKASMRYSKGWSDWRGLFGCAGA